MAKKAAEVQLQLTGQNQQYLMVLSQSEARFASSMAAMRRTALAGAGAIRGAIAGAFAGITAREAVGLSDAATRIDNALKVAGLSGEKLEGVYSRLRDSAISNAAPIEALVDLYSRASLVQKELNISSEELLGFTDKIALALRVSGKSASESSGALLQLSQALGAGVVRAEEFNSILEGALPIAQAAAVGLEEAGGSVSKLRALVVDGQVSSEAFFRAFEAGSVTLEQRVAGATLTVAQATGNLYTALVDVAREFNHSTGASERFAGGVNSVAQAIADFDVSGFVAKIQESSSALEQFLSDIGNAEVFRRLNEAMGLVDANGKMIVVETDPAKDEIKSLEGEVKDLQEFIAQRSEIGLDTTEATAHLQELLAKIVGVRAAMAGMPPPATPSISPGVSDEKARQMINDNVPFDPLPPLSMSPKTVSLKDFSVPSKAEIRSRKGRTKRDTPDDYEREVEQINKRIAALNAETVAQRGLNPAVNDYGFALEQARAKHDLLTAAQEAGKKITPELRAEIDALATKYAQTTVEAEKLAEAQGKALDDIEGRKEILSGALSDLRAALSDGKLEFKELGDIALNVLDKIIDKIQDQLVDSLVGMGSGGGGGGGIAGIISSLFGGLLGGGGKIPSGIPGPWGASLPGFANGTNNFAGGLARINERGGEIVNLPSGTQIIPHDVSIKAMRGASGGSTVNAPITFAPVIQGSGNRASDQALLADMRKMFDREFVPRMVSGFKTIKMKGLA